MQSKTIKNTNQQSPLTDTNSSVNTNKSFPKLSTNQTTPIVQIPEQGNID